MFHAEFEATNNCNTRCLHCPHEVMSRPRGMLDWDTYETVVGKIRRHVKGERFSLSFSGMGEPILNPLLPRFIRHVSNDATTAFATNGAALTTRNIQALIESGLDVLYVSFNGDESPLYEKMMGGIPFERALRNLRQAVAMSRGSRLVVNANVSVTKANRDKLTSIRRVLNDEGVTGITYSMCHTRGGSLRDAAVFDTPPIPPEVTHCDVLRGTLFIDWRGKAFICDHDIHGEHCLGDLVAEPIEDVLERRAVLVRDGVRFKICGECTDVLKMGFKIFPDDVGGTMPDWIYDLYRDEDGDALKDASPHLRWLFTLYKRENRLDRMVGRLIARGKVLENRLADEIPRQMDEIARLKLRVAELDSLATERESRILQLDIERRAPRRMLTWPVLRLEQIIRRRFAR